MNKITLIGLTSITLSMGLKLKELGLSDLEITGSCNDNSRLNLAKKIGSIDKSTRNLKEAVENSKIIVIDSDMNETIELIEAISEVIDKDTIITDTGIMKQPIVKYLNENINREVQFIPGRPLIKDDITDIKNYNSILKSSSNLITTSIAFGNDIIAKQHISKPIFIQSFLC